MSEISPLRPSPRLISCAGAFPARISVLPAREQGWQVRDPACFSRWPESLGKFDPGSCVLRTSQRSLLGGWIPYSGHWPLSGMMRDGEVCERQRWAHRTDENGGSVSRGWPTPTKNSGGDRKHCGISGTTLSGAAERVKAWPTMTTSEAKRGHGYQRAQGRIDPTLTGATGAAKAWPTATATDYKGSSKPGQRQGQLTEPIEPGSGGRLNPAWVEMLMGFPEGWTLTDGPPLRGHSTPTSHREQGRDSPTTATD